MRWFTRRKSVPGWYRITSVTPMQAHGSIVLNGVPQQKLSVSGIVGADGVVPTALSFEIHAGNDRIPVVGQLLRADVEAGDRVRATVHWADSDEDRVLAAAHGASEAQVVAELLRTGAVTHEPGRADPLGIAVSDPAMADKVADQFAAMLDTPISLDVDIDGVRKTVRAGGGGHLSSAEAAQLLKTGVPATATITRAARVTLPPGMLPGPEASLWDLDLTVRRSDGTTYAAHNRTAYRTEARRAVLGGVGLEIPVRIDPDDESRVAVDGDTYDASHPGGPPR